MYCHISFQDPNKRFGASMGSLSLGRMGIISVSVANLQMCLPIAIRYAAIRRQFGPQGEEEVPILEYQLHVRILSSFIYVFMYLLEMPSI